VLLNKAKCTKMYKCTPGCNEFHAFYNTLRKEVDVVIIVARSVGYRKECSWLMMMMMTTMMMTMMLMSN